MKKNVLAGLITILLTMAFLSPVEASITSGATCKVLGQVDGQMARETVGFTFYSCQRINAKLTWTSVKPQLPTSTLWKKLIASRATVIYPGQGKKCVINDCAIGSVGPGGGIVFYDAGSAQSWGRYLEVAPIGWSGRGNEDTASTWCNPNDVANTLHIGNVTSDQKIIPFTGQSIGLGKVLTLKMLEKCPLGAAFPVTNYFGGNTADWYLPSVDELNELCKFSYRQLGTTPDVICDSVGTPQGSFMQNAYWSSSQTNAKGYPAPAAYISKFFSSKFYSEFGTYYVDPMPNPRAIRPIRAFGSPTDQLIDAGIVQFAGFGDPNWPAKCPVVIDTQKTAQPKVTAIKFINSNSLFSRLKNSSNSAVTVADALIGCYVNFDELKNGGSFYSVGSVNRDKSGYFWQNGGGDTVGGRIRLNLTGSVLTATTGEPETISLIP